MLDTIGGEKIAVPLGTGENNQTGLIRLNEVGAFLWEKLMEGTTEEDLVQDVTKQYNDIITGRTSDGFIRGKVKQTSISQF